MALAPVSAICPKCGKQFTETPKRSFLGFQKLTCPGCAAPVVYPLTSGYRITYWVMAIFMILAFIGGTAEGNVMVPGLWGIAVIWGLVEDFRIRQAVAKRHPKP